MTFLGRVTVTDSDEPPPLSGRLEVPAAPAPEVGRVVQGHAVPLAAAVHHLRGEVDELVVLHLEDALLLPAAGQVGLVSVHFGPLGVGVVVEVEVLDCVLLRILNVVLELPVEREETKSRDEVPIFPRSEVSLHVLGRDDGQVGEEYQRCR